MKRQHSKYQSVITALVLFSIFSADNSKLFAQVTAFTYQGWLANGTSGVNGSFDFTFSVWTNSSGPAQLGSTLTNTAVTVSNGLFTVNLDFGSGVFTGPARYIEIGVRTNGLGSFALLSPRHTVSPTPYAIYTPTAGVSSAVANGGVTATQLSTPGAPSPGHVLAYNGSSLVWTNAGAGVTGWGLTGNSGTISDTNFIGTSDNQPLEFKVNSQRALRLEPVTNDSPNVIAGSLANGVGQGVVGGTIGGGGTTNYFSIAYSNWVSADFGTIGGGLGNIIHGYPGDSLSSAATVSGGRSNTIAAFNWSSTIGGGQRNTIGNNGAGATISGGLGNSITGGLGSSASTVGGGSGNSISGGYMTIAGGQGNSIASSTYATIGGGQSNIIYATGLSESIAATICGGSQNSIQPYCNSSTIGGGYSNTISFSSPSSTVGGGEANIILSNAFFATIPGGRLNRAAGYSFASGYNAQATNSGSFVWADGTGTLTTSSNANSVTYRASGGYRFFTGTGSSGAQLAAGATAWSVLSDRNQKKNITLLDCQAVLDKLSAVPVEQWNYNWEADDAVPHIGPMAQDFKSAFYPGRDDKSITTLEFDGVELAAIQGLNQKLKQKDAEILELKQNLVELKSLVQSLMERR